MADVTDNALGADLHSDQDQAEHTDTSIGGDNISDEAENEQEVIEHAHEEDFKDLASEPEDKEDVAKCPEPNVGATVTYFTKVSDQNIIGDGYGAGTAIVARVISQNEDGSLELESVSAIAPGGQVFKVGSVFEGGNAGHYKVI